MRTALRAPSSPPSPLQWRDASAPVRYARVRDAPSAAGRSRTLRPARSAAPGDGKRVRFGLDQSQKVVHDLTSPGQRQSEPARQCAAPLDRETARATIAQLRPNEIGRDKHAEQQDGGRNVCHGILLWISVKQDRRGDIPVSPSRSEHAAAIRAASVRRSDATGPWEVADRPLASPAGGERGSPGMHVAILMAPTQRTPVVVGLTSGASANGK